MISIGLLYVYQYAIYVCYNKDGKIEMRRFGVIPCLDCEPLNPLPPLIFNFIENEGGWFFLLSYFRKG